MMTLEIETLIHAPSERCFDLARSVDAHLQSTAHTGERVVGGRTSGLMELGETVTWEARHLGLRWRLTSQITAFDRPTHFQDRMTAGPFRSFEHDHFFDPTNDGQTVMRDVVRFSAPLGPLGWLAERLFLARHLRTFLVGRGGVLKAIAEAGAPLS